MIFVCIYSLSSLLPAAAKDGCHVDLLVLPKQTLHILNVCKDLVIYQDLRIQILIDIELEVFVDPVKLAHAELVAIDGISLNLKLFIHLLARCLAGFNCLLSQEPFRLNLPLLIHLDEASSTLDQVMDCLLLPASLGAHIILRLLGVRVVSSGIPSC